MRFYLAGAFVSVLLYVSCVETSSLMEELRAAEEWEVHEGMGENCWKTSGYKYSKLQPYPVDDELHTLTSCKDKCAQNPHCQAVLMYRPKIENGELTKCYMIKNVKNIFDECTWGKTNTYNVYKKGGLRCAGIDNGCCTSANPCKENDGDCDSNSHCEGGLYCGTDNCDWGDGDDCCFSVGPQYRKKMLNAITSTINNPPSKRDTTSQRSKLLQKLPTFLREYYSIVGLDVITKHDEWYEEVFKDLFLKIVANPELEEHFPDFTSAFQKTLLPTAIQKEDINSPLLKLKLKTPFPKAVDDSAELEVKEVTIDGTYVNKCAFHDCSFGTKWISTDLYAKQGQLVSVTVPEELAGKFAIRVGSHTDEVLVHNNEYWLEGKKFLRPCCIAQKYGKELIKPKTRLLTPYGGLIYIDINAPIDLGTFTLKFENVITSPRFKQGETTKKEWTEMLASSKSPMVELDVPGFILTLPRWYVDKESLNMERLSNVWTKIMKAFVKMQGFEMPRPHRYVYDVDLSAGSAHAGYPIVDGTSMVEIKQLANGDENNVYEDTVWTVIHETAHMIQQDMWNPSGLGETTNDIFTQYINEVVLKSNPKNQPNLWWAVDFKENGKKFSDLENKGKLNIFSMIKQECSWETYRKFFKYYNEIPKSLIPKTKGKRYSTIAKVLSEKCNKNLIPFFKWWNWPSITAETEEATKNLPPWDGIIDVLNSVDKSAVLRRCNGDDNGCCTAENPCEENDGDCDNDNHCAGDLVCGNDNCAWGDSDDCCKARDGSKSLPGCKNDSDVDYYGFELGSKKTSGERECAELCYSDKRCEVWSLRKSDGQCWIKNGNPYRISRPGFLSGTQQCGAKEESGGN